MQLLGLRQTAPAPRLTPTHTATVAARPSQRAALQVRRSLIGDVNDPEKTHQNKEKKEKVSQWAEPSNKNPLEKKTVVHGGSEAAEDVENLGEKAKGAVDSVKEKVEETVKGN